MASHFGDPAYWMNPDLPDELLATALVVITPAKDRDPDD